MENYTRGIIDEFPEDWGTGLTILHRCRALRPVRHGMSFSQDLRIITIYFNVAVAPLIFPSIYASLLLLFGIIQSLLLLYRDCRIVLPTGFALIAFILSFATVLRCNFAKFTSTSGFDKPITVQFGPWRHETLNFYNDGNGYFYIIEACTSYPYYDDEDSNWKAAQAFTILPIVLGGVALILISMAACDMFIAPWLNGVNGVTYLLASLFHWLSLLFLSSNACKNNLLIREMSSSSIRDDVAFEETCSALFPLPAWMRIGLRRRMKGLPIWTQHP